VRLVGQGTLQDSVIYMRMTFRKVAFRAIVILLALIGTASLGITVRKTIDTLIATGCIEKGLALLYSDKDFDAFVEHLGLQSAISGT
jgi:predicted nucleic acid-binding protein